MAYRLLSLTAISGEFPTDQLNRLPGSPYYLESVVTALKKDGLLRTYYRDKLRGYRLGPRAKATLLESRPDRFASYLTGDTDTNRLKCEIDRRLRLHRLAETYVTMDNAGVCVYRDEKPAIFAPEGYAGGRIVYPAFFSSREVKEMGIDTTKIRSSRSTGILLAPSGIFVTYNSSSALMKWRYKSEMRVKALIWSVICQQRLSSQFRHEDVHGLILGNSMDLAYQILTSTGGRKHDFFMLDGSYEHFLYLTNDHQGEVILALLCDPGKTAELDRILLQGLTARQPGLAIEHDGISPDGSPVLFGYFCDLPRIARFNTSLDTCTPMFIAALFIIARTWKQPRCPSADEWIRKLWYIYTMEYYSAVKKNSFESVLMRWMKLEPIIQSEVSQKEKHQYSILTHIYGI